MVGLDGGALLGEADVGHDQRLGLGVGPGDARLLRVVADQRRDGGRVPQGLKHAGTRGRGRGAVGAGAPYLSLITSRSPLGWSALA